MIKEKLKLLPDEPGCYLMKDKDGTVIYVGKAKSLKHRVKQYFTGAHNGKTQRLVLEIVDFEFIITSSEKDSLLLEFNLIKKYDPKYNIALKDGKTYPYIKLNPEATPILSITRQRKSKKAMYFGPFPNVGDARNTILLLNRLYGLYESRYLIEKESKAYELQQQSGKYIAQYRVSDEVIQELKRFLNGDTQRIVSQLKTEMKQLSDALEFEKAQEKLELLQSIEHVTSKNQVQLKDKMNKDLFNYYSENGYICIQLFMIRQGKLIERVFKVYAIYAEAEDEFVSFIYQYYQENDIPKEVIIPKTIDATALNELLQVVVQPQKGEKLKMLLTVKENAKKQLQNHFMLQVRDEKKSETWNNLGQLLNLSLSHIEVFDNSHIAGASNVSGMIVMRNGEFSKKEYRQFKLSEYVSDYHSMKEVIYRRYFRVLNENLPFPSAIIVDGGVIQINAAKEILNDLALTIPLFGLVKDDKHKSAQLLDEYGTVIEVDKRSDVFFLLTRIQDEVHRYAISFHRNQRSKRMTKSFLDEITGLGEKRKVKLLHHFKSIKKIKEASFEELSKIVPINVAQAIIDKRNES